jgi:hypothetical protein
VHGQLDAGLPGHEANAVGEACGGQPTAVLARAKGEDQRGRAGQLGQRLPQDGVERNGLVLGPKCSFLRGGRASAGPLCSRRRQREKEEGILADQLWG